MDNIDLSSNAFAFKFDPTDFNEALKKFAPSSSKGVDPTEDESVKVEMIICKHCNRQIEYKNGGYIHAEGLYRGKQRCDTNDSQLVYGYNADPVGAACSPICLGYVN